MMNNSCGQETLCIRANKVYDWVTRQAEVNLTFTDYCDLGFDCNDDNMPCAENSHVSPTSEDPCMVLDGHLTVECFPTDKWGNPVDPTAPHAISCEEIPQPEGRQSSQFQLPDGSTVTLQKVKVLKKGYVRVKVTNHHGDCCVSDPIHWCITEKFFLCAPPGTFLECEVTDFECEANLICKPNCEDNGYQFQQLDISIIICQSVQMEAKVKIELTADFCQPRQDLPFVCPPLAFPPQCPTIFPNAANEKYND